jgi:hypothetical protein
MSKRPDKPGRRPPASQLALLRGSGRFHLGHVPGRRPRRPGGIRRGGAPPTGGLRVSVLVLVLQIDLVHVRVSVTIGGVAVLMSVLDVLMSVLDVLMSVLGVHVRMHRVLVAVLVLVRGRVGVLVGHQDSPFVTSGCHGRLPAHHALMLTCTCMHVKSPT